MSGTDVPRADGLGDGAPIAASATTYVVYTDGSCSPIPAPAAGPT